LFINTFAQSATWRLCSTRKVAKMSLTMNDGSIFLEIFYFYIMNNIPLTLAKVLS